MTAETFWKKNPHIHWRKMDTSAYEKNEIGQLCQSRRRQYCVWQRRKPPFLSLFWHVASAVIYLFICPTVSFEKRLFFCCIWASCGCTSYIHTIYCRCPFVAFSRLNKGGKSKRHQNRLVSWKKSGTSWAHLENPYW